MHGGFVRSPGNSHVSNTRLVTSGLRAESVGRGLALHQWVTPDTRRACPGVERTASLLQCAERGGRARARPSHADGGRQLAEVTPALGGGVDRGLFVALLSLVGHAHREVPPLAGVCVPLLIDEFDQDWRQQRSEELAERLGEEEVHVPALPALVPRSRRPSA